MARRFKSITVVPANGGRLMSRLSSDSIAAADYVVKRDWRRIADVESRREGYVPFRPNAQLPEGNQPWPDPELHLGLISGATLGDSDATGTMMDAGLILTEAVCREQFNLSWLMTAAALRYVVQIAADPAGPWTDYLTTKLFTGPGPYSLDINNEWDGDKYFRVKPEVGVYNTVAVHPSAPDVSKCSLTSMSNTVTSPYPNPAGPWATDGIALDPNYNPILNGSIVFTAIMQRLEHYNPSGPTGGDGPTTVTLACTTPGATIRFTTDGTDPALITDGQANGTNASCASVGFGMIIKARAFLGGCRSPLCSFIVDKRVNMLAGGLITTQVATAGLTQNCDLTREDPVTHALSESGQSCLLYHPDLVQELTDSVCAALAGSGGAGLRYYYYNVVNSTIIHGWPSYDEQHVEVDAQVFTQLTVLRQVVWDSFPAGLVGFASITLSAPATLSVPAGAFAGAGGTNTTLQTEASAAVLAATPGCGDVDGELLVTGFDMVLTRAPAP